MSARKSRLAGSRFSSGPAAAKLSSSAGSKLSSLSAATRSPSAIGASSRGQEMMRGISGGLSPLGRLQPVEHGPGGAADVVMGIVRRHALEVGKRRIGVDAEQLA